MALREPTQADPIEVQLDKPSPKGDLRIDAIPDGADVFVEIAAVGGAAFSVDPSPTLPADKGEAWLKLEDGGGLLTLKMKSSLKRGLTLEFSPHLQQPSDDIKPQPLVVRQLPQIANKATTLLQQLQLQIQQANQALRSNLPSRQKAMIQQNIPILEQQLEDGQQYVQRLAELQTWLESTDNKLEIHARVYCDADSAQIDLVRAGNITTDSPE
jgi:hypothetical protein